MLFINLIGLEHLNYRTLENIACIHCIDDGFMHFASFWDIALYFFVEFHTIELLHKDIIILFVITTFVTTNFKKLPKLLILRGHNTDLYSRMIIAPMFLCGGI